MAQWVHALIVVHYIIQEKLCQQSELVKAIPIRHLLSLGRKAMLQDLGTKIFSAEYILKNVTLTVENQSVSKTFEVEVLASGEYYLNTWVMGAQVRGSLESLEVFVDGQEKPTGKIEMVKTGWQTATMNDHGYTPLNKPLSFSVGTHAISFRCQIPEVPAVEFIQLSRQNAKAELSTLPYDSYIDSLKSQALPENYAQIRQGKELELVLDNPEGDYAHEVDINFTYTFYKSFYFTAGTDVVFETKKDNPYASDPYMYLFRANEPINQSTWANDDGGAGYQSKISVHIEHTDYYILLVRAYNSNQPGTSDLWKDGSLYISDIPLAGTKLYCGNIVTSETLNFFTSHLTGDSRLWLQSYYTGNGIVAYNDDYPGAGDFYWGLASRVKAPVYRIRYAIISAYSSYNPTGTCDVYMGCRNSTIMSYFPQLKADDAVRSAPASETYNCISWAGGRTNLGRYFWPPDAGNPWRGSTDLESFDNFFGNTKNGQTLVRKSPKAMNFTRSGANATNAVVALWRQGNYYTHASITKPGNDQPHGYNWESKPGGLMRTFHPRDALGGNGYGQIVAYYRWDGTYSYGNPPMKTETTEGSSSMDTIDNVEFSQSDKEKLYELLFAIPETVGQEFERKYQAWKETWSDPKLQIHSNPQMFAQSEAYVQFLSYCREKGKLVWPLIFSKYEQGDELVINAIEELTFPEYSEFMERILADNLQLARESVTVTPSQTANWTKYIINVLSEIYANYR